jgi:hypothetical protein
MAVTQKRVCWRIVDLDPDVVEDIAFGGRFAGT